MSKPGICILSEHYHPMVGGTETQTRLLTEDLLAAGFGIVVVTRRCNASLPAEDTLGKARIFRVGPVGIGPRTRWAMLFTCIPKLITLRAGYDIIFVTGFRALGVSAIIMRGLFGKKCVFRSVSNGEMSGAFFEAGLGKVGLRRSSVPVRMFVALRNVFLRRADRFVAMSPEVVAELTACGVKPGAIRNIPNCVDTSLFRPATPPEKSALRRKLGLPVDGQIVVYTGRLVSYKGLPLLIRVWKDIMEKRPAAHLVLVGSQTNDMQDCEAELRDFVGRNGLEANVHFTGGVSNVHEYLMSADAFVLPTENELFSNSIIEAMACGLPVICTGVGALKDIVSDSRNGRIVEVGSHEGLRNALAEVLGDAALARSLGDAGLRTVLERYSKDIVARQYRELFTELAK